MPTLNQFVDLASTLPAMPEVAQQLLRSFDREDLSLRQLADLVALDTTLAARVLRLANSARFSPAHQISNLRDAAATLGLTVMRDMSLASCLSGTMPNCPGFDRMAFWRGNMALATYATTFSQALGTDEDTAYVAGLMLRTGQLLMAIADPVAFQQVSGQKPRPDARFAAEATAFGLVHTQVTAALARRWQFPNDLVAGFEAAGDPMGSRPFNRMGAALRLASLLTDCRSMGTPDQPGLQDAQGELLAHLQLDMDWLQAHLCSHELATAGVDSLLQ